jgi:hypothetical protein
MKTKSLALFLCGALLVPAVAFAGYGEGQEAEATVNNAVAHYAAIGTALASDSTEGVAEHAQQILAIMDAHDATEAVEGEMKGQEKMSKPEMSSGMTSEESEAHHAAMRKELRILATKGTDLEDSRAAYKALSKSFVPMVEAMYQKKDTDPNWVVMHCDMAKANWIQADGKVANPFFGSKMPTCGKKVAALASAKGMSEMHGEKMNGMEHEGHQMQGKSKEKTSKKHY